jgi:hypothetical protein
MRGTGRRPAVFTWQTKPPREYTYPYISTLLDRVERETASTNDSFLVEEAAEATSGRRQNIRGRLSKSMGEEYGSPLAQGKPRPSEFSGTSVMRD